DGTVLISTHGFRESGEGNPWNSSRAFVHRVDPETGEGLGVGEITVMRTETSSHAFHIAADKYGDIFYSAVFPGEPIRMMDSDFEFILNVSENRSGFARAITAFTDEDDVTRVYQPTNFVTELGEGDDVEEVGGRVEVHEGDFISGFEVLDTLSIIGMDPGAVAVYPDNGVLFASASGTGNNPEGDPERWDALTIYGINVIDQGNIEVVDQLAWDQGEGDPFNPIYRAMAISPDGLNLVVGGFAGGAHIQWFTRDSVLEIGTSAGERLTDLPEGYNLDQNYPNPFNPTTQINFELGQSGMATLKVYDVLGREVATLVNSELSAGAHSVNFDAANLASGTYTYRLEANGFVLSRKMMLVK
ncbi:MAG: T9SS type A sorting domain-containing protein, partial [Cyclonatronaceae bacterium]